MMIRRANKRRSSPAARGVWVPQDMAGHRVGYSSQVWRRTELQNATARVGRSRLMAAATLFAVCFTVIAGRLLMLAALSDGQIAEPHIAAHTTAPRAEIVDRNGVILATNLRTASLYADARHVLNPEAAASQLVAVFPDLAYATVLERLQSERPFVWIRRNLTPRQQALVNDLGIPGLDFMTEERRVYPLGRLTSHVVGYVDIDNNGIAGIEKGLDSRLRDPVHQAKPLRLSLDVRIQHALRDELQRGMAEFEAVGAAGIVLDVQTGEVIGMSSLPDFDPNDAGAASDDARFNRTTLGVYEMGSTFKAFTVAMALESGASHITDAYDAIHPIKVGRFSIRDYHPERRRLTVPEIFVHSSNIGAAKIALAVGAERQQEFLRRLGLMTPAPIELPERGEPLTPAQWREVSTMTVGFGHGIAVTPLHVAAGIAALTNGGLLHRTTLLPQDMEEPVPASLGAQQPSERVLSPENSALMRGLMRLVVEEGTGNAADMEGYLVGGKTGTAEKALGGSYRRKALLTSFVAVFPSSEPRYLVLAMMDEPRGNKKTFGFATAGWTAAPVAGRIIERVAPLLGVEPVLDMEEQGDPPVFVSLRP